MWRWTTATPSSCAASRTAELCRRARCEGLRRPSSRTGSMRSTAPGGGAAAPPMRALRCVVRWNATSGRSKARTTADDPHRRDGSLPPDAASPVLVVLELHQRFEVERQCIDRVAHLAAGGLVGHADRSEEHTSELQSLMRISYAVF